MKKVSRFDIEMTWLKLVTSVVNLSRAGYLVSVYRGDTLAMTESILVDMPAGVTKSHPDVNSLLVRVVVTSKMNSESRSSIVRITDNTKKDNRLPRRFYLPDRVIEEVVNNKDSYEEEVPNKSRKKDYKYEAYGLDDDDDDDDYEDNDSDLDEDEDELTQLMPQAVVLGVNDLHDIADICEKMTDRMEKYKGEMSKEACKELCESVRDICEKFERFCE